MSVVWGGRSDRRKPHDFLLQGGSVGRCRTKGDKCCDGWVLWVVKIKLKNFKYRCGCVLLTVKL